MTIEYDEGSGVFNKFGYADWRVNSLLHRLDGPAMISSAGQFWYLRGVAHRVGAPANIWKTTGDTEWCLNGDLHRLDGPAVEYKDGSKEWYQYGLRHRIDGPAIDFEPNNHAAPKRWFFKGERVEIGHRKKSLIIGQTVTIKSSGSVCVVLRHVEGVFYELLLGNKKILAYSC